MSNPLHVHLAYQKHNTVYRIPQPKLNNSINRCKACNYSLTRVYTVIACDTERDGGVSHGTRHGSDCRGDEAWHCHVWLSWHLYDCVINWFYRRRKRIVPCRIYLWYVLLFYYWCHSMAINYFKHIITTVNLSYMLYDTEQRIKCIYR